MVAGLIGCVYSAPIPAHLHSNVDSSLELFATRARKFSVKHAAEAVIIKNKIDKHFNPGHSKATFWSGTLRKGGSVVSVKETAHHRAEKAGKKTIGHALHEAGIPESRIDNNPHAAHIWDHASAVWAQKSHGHADVVLGELVRPESVYNRIEKPILMNNKEVTKVVEWNAHTNKETHIKP